ncbi:MAG: hypothetical protein ACLP9L_13525 [Thermoguttaceae bacterium]
MPATLYFPHLTVSQKAIVQLVEHCNRGSDAAVTEILVHELVSERPTLLSSRALLGLMHEAGEDPAGSPPPV